MKIFIVGAVVLAGLAGCAAPKPQTVTLTRVQVVRERVPAGLLSCAAEPAVPRATLQSQVAGYIVGLHAAWRDCSDTVAAVKAYDGAQPAGSAR